MSTSRKREKNDMDEEVPVTAGPSGSSMVTARSDLTPITSDQRLTDLAASMWQVVKSAFENWSETDDRLKQTYGPVVPPHGIYRELFRKEQGDETTDDFLFRARALIGHLPSDSLSTSVQIDMIYGLLNKRIREKLPRSACTSFAEMLSKARSLEDVVGESRPQSTPKPNSDTLSTPKSRAKKSAVKTSHVNIKQPQVTCHGCGAPGVKRPNCSTCNQEIAFSTMHSVGSSEEKHNRPALKIKIFDGVGYAIVDTAGRQCIANRSLRDYLFRCRHPHRCVYTELKLMDGLIICEGFQTFIVDVEIKGKVIPTTFMVLPQCTEIMLGIDFIRDAGLMLDFSNHKWSLAGVPGIFNIEYNVVEVPD